MTDTETPRPRRSRRFRARALLTPLLVLLVVVGLGAAAVATGGGSTVTRARLERSLPQVFSQLYVQQSHLLGRKDVSVASLQASAMCDKDGPEGPDVGPGGTWVCLMSWHDPQVPMPPEGYGKFELNVHSNDCYTASGPSKLTGFQTITDTRGRDVTNPLFEFDGCFDPGSDTSATGVYFPSLVSVTSTTLTPDAQGRVSVQLACGTGAQGCAGTVTASAGDTPLGGATYDVAEEHTAQVRITAPVPTSADSVTFTLSPTTGVGPSSAVTVPVQQRGAARG